MNCLSCGSWAIEAAGQEQQLVEALDRRLSSLLEQKREQFKSECERAEQRVASEVDRNRELDQELRSMQCRLENLLEEQAELHSALAPLEKEVLSRKEFNNTSVRYNSQQIGEKAAEKQRLVMSMARELKMLDKALRGEVERHQHLREKEQLLARVLRNQETELAHFKRQDHADLATTRRAKEQ